MNDELMKAFNWRYAVKAFDATKKISAKDQETLWESLRLAPSSYGLQPWKFFVVEKQELKTALREHSWGQSQVEDCSHLVVFTTLTKVDEAYVTKFMESIASTRGIEASTLDGYKKMIVGDIVNGPRSEVTQHWAQKQAYIAMGQLMLSAAMLDIDSCPLEGIVPGKYDELLGLESTPYRSAAAVALGYRSGEDKYSTAKKVRFPLNEMVELI